MEPQNEAPGIIDTVSARSADGSELVSFRSGSGPALLLIAGVLMDHGGWDAVAPWLRPHNTLYALDRRGRGASGDATGWSPEREIEDLFAVVRGIEPPVDILAHSSGAVLALMAAQRGLPVRRLVLYEPPLLRDMPDSAARLGSERLTRLVKSGEREEALRLFLSEGLGLSAATIERASNAPYWQSQLELVHTVLQDPNIVREHEFDAERLRAVAAPTLLLTGSESPYWMKSASDAFASALPDAHRDVLEGQGHLALFGAPRLLAEKTLRFLAG